jgi:molecular chaperone GrpE
VSAVLADFRSWLTALTSPDDEASGVASAPRETSEAYPHSAETLDLHTLLGQFLAVRQEVNLQTRAVRAQQEQNAETLRQLSAALDALRGEQTRGEQTRQQAVEDAMRPLLKTLIDLYDVLAIAGREVQRMNETVQPSLDGLAAEEMPAAPRSFWARLFRPSAAEVAARQERQRRTRENSARVRQMLASLVTGYTMSLQRVERALRQHGLDAIPTTQERFDPERMEVVEAVIDSGRPAGAVIEEVRRGYLWNGRVFRYAQVRVAK